MSDAAADRGVSYRNFELFVAYSRCLFGIRSIHLYRFTKRNSKGFEKLVARALLTVNARDFFNPADPPLTVLLHYSRVTLVHADTSRVNCTSEEDSTIQHPRLTTRAAEGSPVEGNVGRFQFERGFPSAILAAIPDIAASSV